MSMLAEKLLLTYAEHGDLSHLDLLDTLGDSILMSPKLMFLSMYCSVYNHLLLASVV